jgi:hypothetical protein
MHTGIHSFPVTDKQSFIQFLEVLRQDFFEHPELWEGHTLQHCLEELVGYASQLKEKVEKNRSLRASMQPEWDRIANLFKPDNSGSK